MPKIAQKQLDQKHATGYMSVPEVARAFGVDASNVRHLILSGKLSRVNVGRISYVHVSEALRHFAGDDPTSINVALRDILNQIPDLNTSVARDDAAAAVESCVNLGGDDGEEA